MSPFNFCSGPLPNTSNDFWRMVWEQECSVIAMLTGLEEDEKVRWISFAFEIDIYIICVLLHFEQFLKFTLVVINVRWPKTTPSCWLN